MFRLLINRDSNGSPSAVAVFIGISRATGSQPILRPQSTAYSLPPLLSCHRGTGLPARPYRHGRCRVRKNTRDFFDFFDLFGFFDLFTHPFTKSPLHAAWRQCQDTVWSRGWVPLTLPVPGSIRLVNGTCRTHGARLAGFGREHRARTSQPSPRSTQPATTIPAYSCALTTGGAVLRSAPITAKPEEAARLL